MEAAIQLLIVGLILLAVLGFVGSLHQSSYEKTAAIVLQSNLVAISSVLESDFNKIGYHAGKPAIQRADSVFSFLSDLHNSGTVCTVQYYKSAKLSTQDQGLCRKVSGENSIYSYVHVSKLNFAYFDSTGIPTSTLAAIRSVNVMLELQNPQLLDPTYKYSDSTAIPSLFWTKTFYIQN